MLFRKLFGYLDFTVPFRKGKKEKNFNLRMMHGINRISIFMFLICIVLIILKLSSR